MPSKDSALLIRGLVIGKVLTLLVFGGVWWLLKLRTTTYNDVSFATQNAGRVSAIVESSFQTVDNVPTGSFNYGGSTAWAPIRQFVDSQIQTERSEMQLRYVSPAKGSPGSSAGIQMLLNGQIDFSQSSRPLSQDEKALAKQQNITLEQRAIGIDGITVVVNPTLNISGLTIAQLQQIYRGELTNWSQVGGPDLAITAFSQHPKSGDFEIFPVTTLQQKQSFDSNVHYVYSITEGLRKVSSNPGGLYYASARGIVSQCSVKAIPIGKASNQLIPPYREPFVPIERCPRQRNVINAEVLKNGTYPLTNTLFVIIKRNQGKEQQAGEAYAEFLLSERGRKAIEQAGFVRLQ